MKAVHIGLPLSGALALVLATFGPAGAQAPPAEDEESLDRVVAVVGDSVVLLSQILQREAEMRARGLTVPQDMAGRDRFLRDILDELVSNQLLLQAAARDTLLSVDDDLVEERLQEQLSGTEQAFGGRADMEQALRLEGMSIQSYREMMRDQIRQQLLVGQYLSRNSGEGAVEVTDLEMRTFFEEQRGSLQARPATVTFKQVVFTVAPSDSATTEARARIDSLLARVRAGEDFAELATEHSQDPVSAAAGGDLGWFRRGNFVDAFEDAAFNLLEGQVSEVIETPFGFHIIQVDQIRFAERRARHILIRPEVVEGDTERTMALAEEVATRAAAEEFGDLIDEFHDPLMPDSATVPLESLDQMLSPEYGASLRGRTAGDVVGPITFDFRGQARIAVIQVIEQRTAGAYSFDDLKEQIRTTLITQKRREALVENLRRTTHVEIKSAG